MLRRIPTLALSLALGAVASIPIAHTVGTLVTRPDAALKTTIQSCADRNPAPISTIGRLAPGHSATELRSTGFAAVPLIRGVNNGTVVLYHERPLAISSRTSSAAVAELSTLDREPALAQAAVLNAQTADPSLRSCNYRLADNPKAAAIANRGIAFMIRTGLLTRVQVNAKSTTYLLTDNPLDPSQMYFAVILATPATPTSTASQTLTPIVATIEKASGQVISAGVANWYAGQ